MLHSLLREFYETLSVWRVLPLQSATVFRSKLGRL